MVLRGVGYFQDCVALLSIKIEIILICFECIATDIYSRVPYAFVSRARARYLHNSETPNDLVNYGNGAGVLDGKHGYGLFVTVGLAGPCPQFAFDEATPILPLQHV